jgi:hypothetical protein
MGTPAEAVHRPMDRRRLFLWMAIGAAAVLAIYASLFLCFFVDDEAIPLVYARNLIRGRGLVYTVLEGRIEGYSDFLHVVSSAIVLLFTRLVGLSDLAPLAIGKVVSFIAGIAIVMLSARGMQRAGASPAGAVAGLGFLALSGPLALWSCSSLETTTFALLFTGLAFVLFFDGGNGTGDRDNGRLGLGLATILGAALILERIDGFIYAGTIVASAMLWADPRRRRALRTLAVRLVVVLAVFTAFRYAYFGRLLSAPIAAKVLFRVSRTANDIVNAPEESYLRSYLDLFGLIAVPILVGAAALGWRYRSARPATLALIVLGTYVGLVGDWMFGWRFVVALLPFVALVIALAVTRFSGRVAWPVAVAILAWCVVASHAFVVKFIDAHRWPIFWTRPASGVSAWVQPYGDLIEISRGLMHAGDRVAYNQAGILPYALDLENIDDLGICSQFVARLPTTDVLYTAVGRYSPLRNQPVLTTTQAYLLYQDVRFLVSRTHLLRGANRNVVPDRLLDGYFRRVAIDPSGENAIYERTGKDGSAYRRDPSLLTENLTHVSRLLRGAIGAEVVTGRDLVRRFGFAREERTAFEFDGATEVTLYFAARDEEVSAFYLDAISATVPTTLTVRLFNDAGAETARQQFQVGKNAAPLFQRFDPRVRAHTLTLRLQSSSGHDRVTMRDLRLEGQSAALREYLMKNLKFGP